MGNHRLQVEYVAPWPTPQEDPEVAALRVIASAMRDLAPQVQARIARWVMQRYDAEAE